MIYIKDFIYCFLATIFFAYIMNSDKKPIIYSGIISALGYVLYDYTLINYSSIILANLVAIMVISFLGEIISYKLRIPSLVIVFPAVIAFVPGIGLYKTIMNLIDSNYNSFIINFSQTIIIALEIAFIIAINKYFFKKLKKTF